MIYRNPVKAFISPPLWPRATESEYVPSVVRLKLGHHIIYHLFIKC